MAMAGPERVDEPGIQEAEWTDVGLSWAWRGRKRRVQGGVWASGGSGGSWWGLGPAVRLCCEKRGKPGHRQRRMGRRGDRTSLYSPSQ